MPFSVSVLYRFQGSEKAICGGLAQLGERLPCKQEVSGSIPLISTMNGEREEESGLHGKMGQ